MITRRLILTLGFLTLLLPHAIQAQETAIGGYALTPEGYLNYDTHTGDLVGMNGVVVTNRDTLLAADSVRVNLLTGAAEAVGHVRIQSQNLTWVGEQISYNFNTRQMETENFRTGKPPLFAEGKSLHGDVTNHTYSATNGYITTDDVAKPAQQIRARSITIVPGKYFRARNAVVYLGDVPVFYFPYYSRRLDRPSNHFVFTPGYRSSFGPFVLSGYNWLLNDYLDGAFHVDYRQRRGVGAGPDLNLHLMRWGDVKLKYYYVHDEDPNAGGGTPPVPADRHGFQFQYDAEPFTNLTFKSVVSYQSDVRVFHDFFEGDYNSNPQQKTFVEANQRWDNFSLDVYAQPRVNDFFETVERLPEVKLTAFRQQVGPLPLYYESETSAGWYRRLFADTNNPYVPGYSASRADTYHQLTLPWTLFGWLNVSPRVGGRFTYYGGATATNAAGNDLYRGVFNTGAEVSFKASRLWRGAHSSLLDLDGLRHIIEPSVNYVFVPKPSRAPAELPQFDTELPDLRLLPVEFPDYNSVDSIDSQNVLRLGLRNKLQTRRGGQVENLLLWELYTDWRLDPQHGQENFSDLYSDLTLKPRSWMTLNSQTRWDVNDGLLNFAFHQASFEPGDRWSLGVGHWYLRDGFLDAGRSLISGICFYKLSENWGLRAAHYIETRTGRLEEQNYGIYRDLRSWTAALTFRVRDYTTRADDYSVAFTFSFKAAPRFSLGSDTLRPYQLLGD